MTLPDYPLAFYPIAVIAIVLTGISKGGFGAGAGGLSVPILSLVVAPPEAAGIMLPILCAMDLFGVHAYRGRWSLEHLRVLLPGALLGVGFGAIAFGLLPVNAMRLLIGLIAVLFALNKWLALGARISQRLALGAQPPGPLIGAICGLVSGFTSTLAHSGGPPYAVYILSQKLDKTLIVATSAVFFCVLNYAKLVPYYFLGQLSFGNLATALLFAPLAPLGIWFGVWLHHRISEAAFYQVSYTLLFASGVKLIVDAFAS